MGAEAMMQALAEGQHAVVSRAQLKGIGVGAAAVRRHLGSGRWREVTPRVMRLAGAPRSDEQRLLAAVLDAGPSAVASHSSAAWLWRLPGFDLTQPEVSRPRTGPNRPCTVATVHHPRLLLGHHQTVVRRIPATTLVRTVFDVAGQVRVERAERALQAALRSGLRWVEIEAYLAEAGVHGRPGIEAMRALLAAHRGQPVLGSGLEARFLRVVGAAGLPAPRRQVDLGGERWAARVDFLYDELRLVIEINGSWSHTSSLDVAADQCRTARLVAAGYVVLPVPEPLLRSRPDEVVRLVREARAVASRRSGRRNAP